MVHGKLIEAGKTEKLTYRQLRALERMDAKKERTSKLLDLAKETVVAGGRAAQGLFTNQIAGPIVLFLILASDPQLLDAAYNNLSVLAGEAGKALAHTVTSTIPGAGGSGVPQDSQGHYCLRLHPLLGGGVREACYTTPSLRDSAYIYWANRIGGRAEKFNK